MGQKLYELPESWGWSDLNSACSLITDGAHASPKTQLIGKSYITVRDIDGMGNIDLVGCKKISDDDFVNLTKGKCSPSEGSVLFSKDGTVGKVALVKNYDPFVVLSSLAILEPKSDLLISEYLRWFMLSPELQENAIGKKTGAAIKRIVLRTIKTLAIPLPPLNEQKRIVAKLDAIFTRIGTAIIHLQQTLELSKALFASAYNETFDNIDAHEVELGSIADFFNGFAFKGKELIDKGVPVLRISNIQKGGISFSRMAYFPEQSLSQSIQRFYVEPNDIVIAMSGATTGKVAINDSGMRLLQNQRVGRFVIENEYTRKFIYQFLSIKVEQNLQQALGAAQPNLSTKQIKEIKVPLPSLDKQQAIVDHLDALTERVRTLEATTQEKINDLTALKASLLDSAFKGQL